MRLDEERKLTGFFWLPLYEDKKLQGTLKISNGGVISLEVLGVFEDNHNRLSLRNIRISRILGVVSCNIPITLQDCVYLTKAYNELSQSKLTASKALIGVQYPQEEPFTVNSLKFSIEGLMNWVAPTWCNHSNSGENKCTITYEKPDNLVYELANGISLEICFELLDTRTRNTSHAALSLDVYFKLSSKKEIPLDTFLEIAQKLTTLICFALDKPVSIERLVAKSDNFVVQDKSSDIKVYWPITVYYKSAPFTESKPSLEWVDMLFQFKEVKDRASSFFNSWLNAYEKTDSALNLYFSTKYVGYGFIESKFLALAQGLETLHRNTSKETLMEKSEFKKMLDSILNSCPEEHKEWAQARLSSCNQLYLAKRLEKLIDPFKDIFTNQTQFIREVVDTRNYLTHYDKAGKKRACTGKKLVQLCDSLEMLFQLQILLILNFNESEIVSIATENRILNNRINREINKG